MPSLTIDSPQGPITLTAAADRLQRLEWRAGRGELWQNHAFLAEAARQIAAYFAGERQSFDLALDPRGPDFRRRIWDEMLKIPYGETASYGALAARLGVPAKAVGQACAANPIPIVIPCHRVIAADGALGGFSGGAGRDTKAELLALEGWRPAQASLF